MCMYRRLLQHGGPVNLPLKVHDHDRLHALHLRLQVLRRQAVLPVRKV